MSSGAAGISNSGNRGFPSGGNGGANTGGGGGGGMFKLPNSTPVNYTLILSCCICCIFPAFSNRLSWHL